MRNFLKILPFGFLIALTSCDGGRMKPSRMIEVDGRYALAIPGNMLQRNDLHDFAAVQFADEAGGYFLVGIDEDKVALEQLQLYYNIGDYAHFVEKKVAGSFDTTHIAVRDTQTVNGLRCISTDMFGALASNQESLEVFYHLSVLESETHFYQLIGWTRRDRQSVFRDAALSIEQSFHELAMAGKEMAQPGTGAEGSQE